MTINDHFNAMQKILSPKLSSDDMTIAEYKAIFGHLMAIASATDNQTLMSQMAANAGVLLAAIAKSHHYEVNVITNLGPHNDYRVNLKALPEKTNQ